MTPLEELTEDRGILDGLKALIHKYWLAILVFLGLGLVGAAILWLRSHKQGDAKT